MQFGKSIAILVQKESWWDQNVPVFRAVATCALNNSRYEIPWDENLSHDENFDKAAAACIKYNCFNKTGWTTCRMGGIRAYTLSL